ncbi:hypothetical protein D3C86_1472070 [compost metagenome]
MKKSRLQRALNAGPLCFMSIGVVVVIYCAIHFLVLKVQGLSLPTSFMELTLQWWVGLSLLAWVIYVAILYD